MLDKYLHQYEIMFKKANSDLKLSIADEMAEADVYVELLTELKLFVSEVLGVPVKVVDI